MVVINGILGWILLYKRGSRVPDAAKPLAWLGFVLPFAAGGFYAITAVFASGYLLWYVLSMYKKKKKLAIYLNISSAAVLLLTVSYLLTICWAADRGMAPLGFVHILPVALYLVSLMQLFPEERAAVCVLVPWCAAEMVLVSFFMGKIPTLQEMVLVNRRLAGFFEYPNTFAVFLIAAIVLLCAGRELSRKDYVCCAILIFGVLQSGSRASAVFLAAALFGLISAERRKKHAVLLLACLMTGIVLTLAVGYFFGRDSGYNPLTVGASTLLGRLLYGKDLLPVLLQHPFGIGYMGYYAMQGNFQHGVYSVAYVHNELMQLLVDVGWIPGGLCAAAGVGGFFSKRASVRQRLLLLILLGHALVDFDLQFLAIWVVLLPALQLDGGKCRYLRQKHMAAVAAAVSCCLAVSLWLSTGDLLSMMDRAQAALRVTPFYTRALEKQVTELNDMDKLQAAADRLLTSNSYSTLGHDAKANAAYAAGNIRLMIQEKEEAIACSRYTLTEYCDYFEKLYTAMTLYLRGGDRDSARICAEKLRHIPDMLESVRQTTDPLAWKIADTPQLELPEEYMQLLEEIQRLNY